MAALHIDRVGGLADISTFEDIQISLWTIFLHRGIRSLLAKKQYAGCVNNDKWRTLAKFQ
jgi:hypothetical protein